MSDYHNCENQRIREMDAEEALMASRASTSQPRADSELTGKNEDYDMLDAPSLAAELMARDDSYRHPERYVAQSAEVRKLAKDLLDWEASEAAPKYPKDAKDLYDTRFEFRYPLTTLQNGRKESIKVVFSLITYLIEQMASASDENGALLQALGIDEEDEEASRGQMPTPERVRNEMLHVQFAGCKAKLRVMYELLRAAGINGQLPGLKAEELEDILTQFEAAERQAPAEST